MAEGCAKRPNSETRSPSELSSTSSVPSPGTVSGVGAARAKVPPRRPSESELACAAVSCWRVQAGSSSASSSSTSNSTKSLPSGAARSTTTRFRARSAVRMSMSRSLSKVREVEPPRSEDTLVGVRGSFSSTVKFSPRRRKSSVLLQLFMVVKMSELFPSKVMPVATIADTPGCRCEGSVPLITSVAFSGLHVTLVRLAVILHACTAPAELGRSWVPIAFDTKNSCSCAVLLVV
mmetsp:Transcript_27359/g.59773  ORF Transcript_27359/g.59773 Transcript_27359/m.59773 type:complete len:234 (+) Transcript_27359:1726-2427(+)